MQDRENGAERRGLCDQQEFRAGDETGWLGTYDSNSETPSQIIPLKARADSQDPRRILATETIRV